MSKPKFHAQVLLLYFISFFSYGQDGVPAACIAIFSDAVNRISDDSQLSVSISTLRTTACSSSNRNITAGFDSKTKSIVGGVPVVSSFLGSLGISNNKQLCEAYDRGDFTYLSSSAYLKEPVVQALEQANQCIRIANEENLTITHETAGPGKLVFFGAFDGPEYSTRITTTAGGGFACSAPGVEGKNGESVDGKEIVRDVNFSITCERSGVKFGADLDFVEADVVLVTSKGGIYKVSVPPNATLGLGSRIEAQKAVEELQAKADRAEAEAQRLSARRYDPIRYYFGSKGRSDGVFGARIGCEHWSYTTREHQIQQAQLRVCSGGTLLNVLQTNGHSGGACGYNYFVGVCQKEGM